jgi:crotonobetainyl-CoA:carnitine CoA-transferase CaiB-like acyl-CoA transferase
MMGKRWAFLDLRKPENKERFLKLLSEADIARKGSTNWCPLKIGNGPDLVEVGLRAYGWSGPWQLRRGFDTIVQFSSGLAAATQAWALEKPENRVPLVALGRTVDASRPSTTKNSSNGLTMSRCTRMP